MKYSFIYEKISPANSNFLAGVSIKIKLFIFEICFNLFKRLNYVYRIGSRKLLKVVSFSDSEKFSTFSSSSFSIRSFGSWPSMSTSVRRRITLLRILREMFENWFYLAHLHFVLMQTLVAIWPFLTKSEQNAAHKI